MKFKVYRAEKETKRYNLDLNEERVLSDKNIEVIIAAIKDYLEIYNRD